MPGPYVTMATLCEKVLREADGVLSVIRSIDRLMIQVQGDEVPAELPQGQVNTTLVVCLKADDARGRHPVSVEVQLPGGVTLPPQTVDVMFEGEERGVNLILNILVEAMEGLYWFDVSVNSQLLTRVPLRVMYQRVPSVG